MNDRPPQWGEPGYVPPPRPKVPPPGPKVPLRPGQRRALWLALVLAALGQVAYWVAVGGGTSTGGTATANGTCCTGSLYDHPVVAAAGFLASMGALALVVPVVRSWSELLLPRFAKVVPLLVALGLGLDLALSVFAPLGCACW